MTVTIADIHTGFEKLVSLGSTDAIAWELEAQGIKAQPGSIARCAIAQYLGNSPDMNPLQPPVYVNHTRVICMSGPAYVATPKLVADFITKFDQGAYPALVAGA